MSGAAEITALPPAATGSARWTVVLAVVLTAVLEVLETENLSANAVTMGNYLMSQLDGLKKKYPTLIREVRGKGLMVGAELSKPGREVVDRCLKQGVIINCTAGNVLRFVPPLNIERNHVDEVIAILDGVLAQWQ